jgi:hypothetical protein
MNDHLKISKMLRSIFMSIDLLTCDSLGPFKNSSETLCSCYASFLGISLGCPPPSICFTSRLLN